MVAMHQIRKVRSKLAYQLAAVEQKEKDLMSKLIQAQTQGDQLRSKVYANEIANLRKVRANLMILDVKLEQALLRLETALTFGDAAAGLLNIAGEVKVTVEKAKEFLPNMQEELEGLVESLEEVSTEGMGTMSYSGVYLDPEASKILEEAKSIAESKLRAMMESEEGEASGA